MKIGVYVASFSFFTPTTGVGADEPFVAPAPPAFVANSPHAAVLLERIIVVPEPEDRMPATKNRWQRFEEALGPGRSARRTVTGWRENNGVRVECYTRCFVNCCVDSGTFNIFGAGGFASP